MTHLKQGDKPRKVTLKEKKAYAHGYRQAYKDCRDVLTCMKCRIALSSMVEPQVFLQLIELKK